MQLAQLKCAYLGWGLVAAELSDGLHLQQEDAALLVQVEQVVQPVLLGPRHLCKDRWTKRGGELGIFQISEMR